MKDKEIIQYLQNAIDDISAIQLGDYETKDRIFKRLTMYIRRVFGEDSDYLIELRNTAFSPIGVARISEDDYSRESTIAWLGGKKEWINTLKTIIEEVTTFGYSEDNLSVDKERELKPSNKIFIVHGHDGEMMHDCARFIEKLELEPIILKEQPNEGRTIIEKFEDYSDLDFAIVLFSDDDVGKAKEEDELKPRPRQNVVFELGFFIGKLGRKNTVVLHKVVENFEMLSDFQGVIFHSYDEGWKMKVAKELKAAGFNFDPDKLL